MELRKILLAAIGLAAETAESAGELIGELIERGNLLSSGEKDPAERLLDKVLGTPRDAAKIVGEILRDAFDTIGLATSEDIANLTDRIEQTEKMISWLKSEPAPSKVAGPRNAAGARKK